MALPNGRTITDVVDLVSALPAADQEAFERLFRISTTVGYLNPPEEMHSWIEKHFGSVEAVRSQRIVKITNLVTLEGALFNEIRARRPLETEETVKLTREFRENGDPFCKPLVGTPEDVFGRVRGKHSITASNVAKYDGFHGLVIFDEHNPLAFSAEEVSDYIDTALAWARRAHEVDPEARYFFFMWNCLWKSGASILHGHAQMSLSRDIHYARVEQLRRAAVLYRAEQGADYFDDLYTAHRALGLTLENGDTRIVAYLTPIKEKEVLLVSKELDEDLKDSVYRVLRCFTRRLGVHSFNLALCLPPIGSVEEDWSGFPALVRIVDRGDVNNKTSDMGAMELYASSVIASDPFQVIKALRDYFQ